MRFRHALALLGFAVMAAAYSEVGIYERFYLYYAYKLDSMVKGEPTIGNGCKNCDFEQFVNFIEENGSKEKPNRVIFDPKTPELQKHFPEIEATAKLYEKTGPATQVREGRVYTDVGNYAQLFDKLRERLNTYLQYQDNFEFKPSKGEALTGAALDERVQQVKTNLMDSLKQVWQGRAKAALTAFNPLTKYQVVPTADGTAIDFEATLKKNEGLLNKAKLEELWNEHVKNYKGPDAVKEFVPKMLEKWHPTLFALKPLPDYQIVPTADGKAIDVEATVKVKENEGLLTKGFLKSLWNEHSKKYQGENVVKDFVAQKLEKWTPKIADEGGIITMRHTLQGAVKEGWFEKPKLLEEQFNLSYDSGHRNNVESVRDTYSDLEPSFCPKGAAKRAFGILHKRQLLSCIPAAEIEKSINSEIKGLGDDVGPEKPANPGEGGKPNEGSKPGERGKPATDEQVKRANTVSENTFEKSAEKRLGKVPKSFEKQYGTTSFKELRIKALDYKPFDSNSPKLRAGGTGLSRAGKALGVVGAVFYVKGVVDAFKDHVSPIHFFAAISSIVPFLGCVTEAAAAIEDKVPVGFIVAETALCGVADALLFTPFWPAGVALHIINAVVKFFRPPPTPPTVIELAAKRDAAWAHALEDIYRYLYSAYETEDTSSFAVKTENTMFWHSLNILSESADTIGALNATGSAELFDPALYPDQGAVPDKAELETSSKEASEKLEEAQWGAVLRRQRNTLLRAAIATANGSLFQLDEAARETNTNFIKYIESKEFKDVYPDKGWQGDKVAAFFKNWYTSIRKNPGYKLLGPNGLLLALPLGEDKDFEVPDITTFITKRVEETAEYVKSNPPALPRALDVAFILGQSKALLNLPKDTLSPMSFLEVEVSSASEKPFSELYLHKILASYTNQIIDVMYGRMKESDLKGDDFPVQDAQLLNQFRLLIAMKLGAVHEADRVAEIKRRHPGGWDPELLNYRGLIRASTPYIPVIVENPDHPVPVSHYRMLVSGLSDHLADEALQARVARYVESGDEDTKRGWKEYIEHVRTLVSVAQKIIGVRATGPSVPDDFVAKFKPVCVGKGRDDQICDYVVKACYAADNTGDEFVTQCIDEAVSLDKTRERKVDLCAKFPSYKTCEIAIDNCDTFGGSMYSVLFTCAAKAAPDLEAEYAKMAAE